MDCVVKVYSYIIFLFSNFEIKKKKSCIVFISFFYIQRFKFEKIKLIIPRYLPTRAVPILQRYAFFNITNLLMN